MADDWKAGDLAVCIQDDWFRGGFLPMIVAPRKEQVIRVAGVRLDGGCQCGNCSPNGLYLNFAEFGPDWYQAGGFRKVRPDGTEEKVDRQEGLSWFKRLLKRHKAKEPETATFRNGDMAYVVDQFPGWGERDIQMLSEMIACEFANFYERERNAA